MMGESDDEHERRFREKTVRSKFRGERHGDTDRRDNRRSDRRSEARISSCVERVCSGKPSSHKEASVESQHRRKRDVEPEPRHRVSPRPRSPPAKRLHLSEPSHIMEQHRASIYVNPNFLYPPTPSPYYNHPQPYFPSYAPAERFSAPSRPLADTKAPANFKTFLLGQDENITQDEARVKYDAYKRDFLQAQLQEFFKEHRDEEWLKQKYHPDDLQKDQEEKRDTVKFRLDVFMKYVAAYGLDDVVLNDDHYVNINQYLERMSILLEGGTFDDLNKYDSKKTELKVDVASTETKLPSQTDEEVKNDEASQPVVEAAVSTAGEKTEEVSSTPPACEAKVVSPTTPRESPLKVKLELGVKRSPRSFLDLGSLFIRWVPPTVTKAELEELCRKLPGFMRLALADPSADRRWQRRGWITFSSAAGLLESCAVLNATKLHRGSLGVIGNRVLTNKVRPLLTVAGDMQALRHGAALAAKLVYAMDCRHRLWDQEPLDEEEPQMLGFVHSKNPLLKDVLEHITEVASAEEDEYNGAVTGADREDGQVGCAVAMASSEDVARLARFLDGLVLYLRTVFSVDFYRSCEYVNEHQMPHRIGIIHVRGPPPKAYIPREDVTTYCEELEQNLQRTFLTPDTVISDVELRELGLKDPDLEVDKFITAHTTELGPKKWLFQLSGKKFQSADYVRKHAFNKFPVNIEGVRKDTEYFNNYLRDAKRPKPCEPSAATPGVRDPYRRDSFPSSGGWQRGCGRAMRHPMMQPYYNPAGMYGMPRGFRGGFNRGRPLAPGILDMSGRQITDYRDLDCPRDGDEI